MIGRKHGPERRIGIIALAECVACQGKGIIEGVFHQMTCAGCNGSGMVSKESGEALDPQVLVVQLRMRLSQAHARIRHQQAVMESAGLVQDGPKGDYQGMSNRRGIGGGNWTGD